MTAVGLGEMGTQTLVDLFPQIDSIMWEGIGIEVALGAAIDYEGNPVSSAAIMPVPPDCIPAPLPSNLQLSLAVSI